jgi:hypothetical protein
VTEPQAGRELRVRVVLTGRVSQPGDALAISVELYRYNPRVAALEWRVPRCTPCTVGRGDPRFRDLQRRIGILFPPGIRDNSRITRPLQLRSVVERNQGYKRPVRKIAHGRVSLWSFSGYDVEYHT